MVAIMLVSISRLGDLLAKQHAAAAGFGWGAFTKRINE
jgi:hypothetical protein